MKIFGLTTPGIELASKALNFVAESTAQVSSNTANISTPGFKAHEFKDFEQTLAEALKFKENGGMAKTDSRHLPVTDINRMELIPEEINESPRIDGNSVNLEKEAVKLAQNQIKYSAYAAIVDKELGSLKRVMSLSAQ
ncbi:MAG: flagellar basal body rod protein FlgB [Nitrospinae bacterium]|nr:flagellar basal body rod protein FlgB [Nitrospinota bacterium]